MSRVSVKAVALGFVVYLASATVVSILVVFVWRSIAFGKPFTAEGFSRTALIISLVVGLGPMVLGGYVAGRIARRDHVLHGVLVGVASVAIGLLTGVGEYSVWFTAAAAVLDIPMAIAGALLARRPGRPAVGTISGSA